MRISKHLSEVEPVWRSGRIFFYGNDDLSVDLAGVEWKLDSPHKLISLDVDDKIGVTLAFGPFLHAEINTPRFMQPALDRLKNRLGIQGYEGVHVVRISAHDRALWWEFFHSDMSWKSSDPIWRCGNIHFVDALLGTSEHKAVVLSEHDVLVPMPERGYKWHVKLLRREYRRKRVSFWPSYHYCYDASALPGEGISVPGKGENAWDLDDNAIDSCAGPGRSVSDALGSIVSSVMRSRLRYGGSQEMREAS